MVSHEAAEQRVKLGFFIHFAIYLGVIAVLMALNFTRHPEKMWSVWVACGWGAGILLHAALVFLSARTRERMVHRTMERLERRSQAHEARHRI